MSVQPKKIRIKKKILPEQNIEEKPIFHLYEICLAFHVECYVDFLEILKNFHAKKTGYIGGFNCRQGEMVPGEFISDFDITDFRLRVWVKQKEIELYIQKMKETLDALVSAMQETPDAYTAWGSLDFQIRYQGTRDEELVDIDCSTLEKYMEQLK